VDDGKGPIFASDLYENLQQRSKPVSRVLTTAEKTLDGFVGGTCKNKWPDKKNLLAMAIDSDMKAGGVSQGTISRNYEGVGSPSVYPYFQRLFGLAMRGHYLRFQRISGQCSVHSQ
jgi:hypothetical protein